jgi:hypothetical protein
MVNYIDCEPSRVVTRPFGPAGRNVALIGRPKRGSSVVARGVAAQAKVVVE